MRIFRFLICLVTLILVISGCRKTNSGSSPNNLNNGQDTLKVVTLSGPSTYFIYRGEEMGYEYENIKRFAEEEGYVLSMKIAANLNDLFSMLENGEADVAAYPIPYIDPYRENVRYCGPKEITYQVIVQPLENKISDVTELIGKTITVEENSKYHYRIINLDKELGGGININTISRDSIIPEDLIDMVSRGEIEMTIIDSDIAGVNMFYYNDLDDSLQISLEQVSSWAVNKDNEALADKINNWENKFIDTEISRKIYKKYFEYSKQDNPKNNIKAHLDALNLKKGGKISKYDDYFRKFAPIAGMDWEMLASIGFNESRFNSEAVSRFGAQGLMQVMPSTAKAIGADALQLSNPAVNVEAASVLLKSLDKSLRDKVSDPEERQKFIVAAYNSGLGHIYDAIALAKKYGLNPEKWTGNVAEALMLKANHAYYNDPIVKSGYFRGKETIDFVDNVMDSYRYFMEINN